MLPTQFKHDLKKLVKSHEKIVFLGIGENRMGDDGFGPYVSHKLYEINQSPNVKIINGKTNYVDRKEEIIGFNPDLLIIIDACRPNINESADPGNIMISYEKHLVNWLPLSSHVLPIPVFTSEIKNAINRLQTILVGIIPVSTNYNDPVNQYKPELYSLDDYEQHPDLPFYDFKLSPKIQKIADELVMFLRDLL